MEIQQLMTLYSKPGKVVAISIREQRLAPLKIVDTVKAIENKGEITEKDFVSRPAETFWHRKLCQRRGMAGTAGTTGM